MPSSSLLERRKLQLVALIAAAASTGGVIALLIKYDGQMTLEWKNITLHTVVSVCFLFIKALLLYPIATCINKWRRVIDSRIHPNKVTRESTQSPDARPHDLLGRSRTPLILRFGFVVMCLMMVIDPFSQQILQHEHRVNFFKELNGTSAINNNPSDYYDGNIVDSRDNLATEGYRPYRHEGPIMDTAMVSTSMEAAILRGLTEPKEVVQGHTTATFSCPTRDCRWDSFEALGVCSRCNDITSKLEENRKFGDFFNMMWGDQEGDAWYVRHINASDATAFVLPNGHFLANPNDCYVNDDSQQCSFIKQQHYNYYSMTAYSTDRASRSVSLQDVNSTLIRAMSVISVDGTKMTDQDDSELYGVWPNVPVVASECALYWCVKNIDSQVVDNILQEKTSEVPGWRRKMSDDATEDELSLSFLPNSTGLDYPYRGILELASLDPWGKFQVDSSTYQAVSFFLEQTLTMRWENETDAVKRLQKLVPNLEEMFNGAIVGNPMAMPASMAAIWKDKHVDLEGTFESLAISMTNEIRRNGRGLLGNDVKGQVGVSGAVYKVVWPWMAFHGIVLLGSIFFCFATWDALRDTRAIKQVVQASEQDRQ
ncbi:hypothetical protein CC79DRAFT_872769 [Sarocladium strictum]